MIPYKDLCAAIDRYRARITAEHGGDGVQGRVLTARANGQGAAGNGSYGDVAADDHTSTLAVDDFPHVSGAGVEVRRADEEEEATSVHRLSTETNEIDLAGAEVVGDGGDDDLPR